jgi:hypothetical protein
LHGLKFQQHGGDGLQQGFGGQGPAHGFGALGFGALDFGALGFGALGFGAQGAGHSGLEQGDGAADSPFWLAASAVISSAVPDTAHNPITKIGNNFLNIFNLNKKDFIISV